jgi:hypothetical protein
LLALAIKFEQMLQAGEVQNRAALARAGQVSRARLTQIMSLLDLAPAIQERIPIYDLPGPRPRSHPGATTAQGRKARGMGSAAAVLRGITDAEHSLAQLDRLEIQQTA